MMKWNLAVSVDTLEIAGKMNGLLQHTTFQNITKEMTDQTFGFAKNSYNVMIFTSDSKFLALFSRGNIPCKVTL